MQENTSLFDLYIGMFAHGKMNGHGVYHFANGNRYEGDWVDNMKCGHGTWIAKLGDSYIGQFQVCICKYV